jgi:tetraacyldisaccharide 4'-kinase
LKETDVVVVNGAAEHASLGHGTLEKAQAVQMTLAADDARRLDEGDESRPLAHFRGGPLHAVAGIGNPGRFFRELRSRGLEVIEHAFPDHHPFSPADLEFADELPVLMTEKDAVKCRSFANARLWYVPVDAVFSDPGSRELLEHVARKIGSFSSAGD